MSQADGSQSQAQRSWIEFHDSDVNAIVAAGDAVSLHLDAYVHRWDRRNGEWVGTGWIQPVTVAVRNGTTPITQVELPMEIADGYVRVNDTVYQNLVPLPFQGDGTVLAVMELADSTLLQFAGDQVTVTEAGDARFVEDLTADLRPEDLRE